MSARIVIALGIAALFAAPLARADANAGKEKAKQVCAACHGEAGDKPLQPDYPILAGQHRDYLQKSLRDYKSGLRKNPVMGPMAQPLTRDEIRDLADWFSSQSSPLFVKR